MVFSLFKKKPEKIAARPVAVAPRPATGSANTQAPAEEERSEFSDVGFTRSSFDLQVDDSMDSTHGLAEEAAILFADNQDAVAQAVLEDALKQSDPAEILWLMLFDIYRLSGQQSAFEAMGIDYARAFEKSPPIWSPEFEAAVPARTSSPASTPKARGGVLFKGDLLGGNASSFDMAQRALEKNQALRLDVSKVKQVDAEGCAAFLKLLRQARKEKREIELLGRDALSSLLKNSIGEGKETPAGKEGWLLLLELLQQQGPQEVFEDLAIDYAMAFEESPPSWENRPLALAKPEPATPEAEEEESAPDDGAYVLSGEIRNSQFDDLPAFAEGLDTLLIDGTKLARIDFASAGALLNRLTAVRNTGKQIVVRYSNHLVAELFRVVGLTAVAVFVFAPQ